MKLTTSEQSRILTEMLRAKSISTLKLEQLLKSNSVADRSFCRNFARELNAIGMLYEQGKGAARSNKIYSAQRKDLPRALPKRTSKAQFLADAKAKSMGSDIAALFAVGKKLNSTEALMIYTASTKHSGKALSRSDIENTCATQEQDLVSLARRYCKSIGMIVA